MSSELHSSLENEGVQEPAVDKGAAARIEAVLQHASTSVRRQAQFGSSVADRDATPGPCLAIIKHQHPISVYNASEPVIWHSWLVAFPMGATGQALSESATLRGDFHLS